jgi:hypothetical protein
MTVLEPGSVDMSGYDAAAVGVTCAADVMAHTRICALHCYAVSRVEYVCRLRCFGRSGHRKKVGAD